MTSHGFKQNEISQVQTMRTNFFKRSYFTVLGVLSFETIKILMTVPLCSWLNFVLNLAIILVNLITIVVKLTMMVIWVDYSINQEFLVNNPPNIIWFIQSYSWAELARTMVLFSTKRCSVFSLTQFKILISIKILSSKSNDHLNF